MTDAEPEVRLAGKRALVTGAGTRVGRAIAVALGREAMHVIVHFHSHDTGAEETAALVRDAGGTAETVSADLATRVGARGLAEAVLTAGPLDLLVASAAGFDRIRYDDIDDAAWDRMLELNLSSPFALAHRLSGSLRQTRGCIVFISCASTRTPFRNHLPYVVSKGGIAQLTRVMSLELAPDVRVNAVAPGTVLPPPGMSAVEIDRVKSRIPLGRLGAAEDIARAVVFLARSPFITGQELFVDGGRTVAGFESYG